MLYKILHTVIGQTPYALGSSWSTIQVPKHSVYLSLQLLSCLISGCQILIQFKHELLYLEIFYDKSQLRGNRLGQRKTIHVFLKKDV